MTVNINDIKNNQIPLTEISGGLLIHYLDQADANTLYHGAALPGTATSGTTWRITKQVTAGAITSILFASGSNRFDKKWDDRATYTYS